jgi:deoxyhypusine monooxygenase
MAFVTPPRAELCSTLLNLERPIAARMRAIFYLRSMGDEHRAENTAVLCQALLDKRGTALFRHEIAYVLGQMQEPLAISDLSAVLRDTKDDVVVRHEVRAQQASCC